MGASGWHQKRPCKLRLYMSVNMAAVDAHPSHFRFLCFLVFDLALISS